MAERVNGPPWPEGTAVVALDGCAPMRAEDLAALEARRRPVIGWVEGACEADALALACVVDLLVAAPGATFGRPGPWTELVLRRLTGLAGRKVAAYLALSGRSVDAARAETWGLVSRISDDPALAAGSLADLVDGRSLVAVEVILGRAHRGAHGDHLRSGLMSWPWRPGDGGGA